MFNIIWIPIYAQAGTGIAPAQGYWVYGDTFDIYPNNSQYYAINIWSGYNATTTGAGGPFTSVVGSPESATISGLVDQGSIGGNWTGVSSVRVISSGYMGFGGAVDNGGGFQIGHNPAYLLNDFTAEIWIKRLSDSWNPSTFARIIEKGFSNGFTVNSNGGNNIQSFVNGTSVNFLNPLPLDVWTHLAVTRSGSEMRLYMSGFLNNQGVVSSSSLTNTSALQVGTSVSEQPRFILLDEFRLWNYPRSSGQITSGINSVIPSETGLLNYLRFSNISSAPSGYGATTGIIYRQYELIEDNFNDYQTGSLAVLAFQSGLEDYGTLGSVWTGTANTELVSSGYIGNGGALNGGCFKCGHNSAYLLNDFTIEFWMKRLSDSWGTSFGRVIEKNYINGFTMNRDGSSNSMSLSIMGDQDAYNNTIPLNQWTHFAAVRSGSTAFLYISGILDKETATSSSQLTNTGPFEVGTDQAEVANQLIIDEVRLWSYARSSGEIVSNFDKTITAYQSGLLNYLRFDKNGYIVDFPLTGAYWFDKTQSGYLSSLKSINGYTIPQSVLESDTFDNYSTGLNYTGTFANLGYTLNKIISGSTGNFYINNHDIFVSDTFDLYQNGTINSLTSGVLISGNIQFTRTGTTI